MRSTLITVPTRSTTASVVVDDALSIVNDVRSAKDNGAGENRTPVPKQSTVHVYTNSQMFNLGEVTVQLTNCHTPWQTKFSFRRGLPTLWNQPDICTPPRIRRQAWCVAGYAASA